MATCLYLFPYFSVEHAIADIQLASQLVCYNQSTNMQTLSMKCISINACNIYVFQLLTGKCIGLKQVSCIGVCRVQAMPLISALLLVEPDCSGN